MYKIFHSGEVLLENPGQPADDLTRRRDDDLDRVKAYLDDGLNLRHMGEHPVKQGLNNGHNLHADFVHDSSKALLHISDGVPKDYSCGNGLIRYDKAELVGPVGQGFHPLRTTVKHGHHLNACFSE